MYISGQITDGDITVTTINDGARSGQHAGMPKCFIRLVHNPTGGTCDSDLTGGVMPRNAMHCRRQAEEILNRHPDMIRYLKKKEEDAYALPELPGE